ncbi:hypothetical protein DL766_002590 [Monosporascus sp. MC13-8B]|uniref:Phosphatidylinositol-specific phospholipase C X domain-containing protein n=1 Tax=Monosporascus cannonballus TaxID=155416 RepID=A0ABY0HEK3_9PEZI|nr:hypothetical protein DL763_010419 [Monosporascus cannonballus]RYO91667.1 hypothetical protein DL762_002105 [Monosporascus cannonballus]RYP35247.1 hypothetical protein DL766_002590 [Monosporascus sp. MC13-8B]
MGLFGCCFPSSSTAYTPLPQSMADLTIRNLTVTPLELKLVERFEGRPTSGGGRKLGKIKDKLTGSKKPPGVSHNCQLQGEPRERSDVSFRISPFETHATPIRTADPSGEVIRLTFESAGHRYQIDVPSATRQSSVMTKLDGGPNEYTTIYVEAGNCLTIFSSAHLPSWMGELRDELPLSALSLPGTHNSPTSHVALPSVRCQAVGIRKQLDNGVRFFDVRVGVSSSSTDLPLVHAAFPVSLKGTRYFADMLKKIYAFLDDNPSETLIMSIKREGIGKGTDQDLSRILKGRYYDGKRWYTEPRIPRLGEVRGKIVLLRRHENHESLNGEFGARGWGLDGSVWPDNCEDGRLGSGIARVQDFYEVDQSTNIQKKIELIHKHLERAGEPVFALSASANDEAPRPFFINFLSASNFFRANCWPERIAAKANPAVIEYLCLRHGEEGKGPVGLPVGDACTGIVVTDWVGGDGDWDLIRCIVGWNAKLQLKK